ncbi:MAG: hypothetical protein JWO94_2243, partial [Verrucomicrobiaceae bacterium]|nr:hypothetical protein [Verrucomicrobiaceae bacterium]
RFFSALCGSFLAVAAIVHADDDDPGETWGTPAQQSSVALNLTAPGGTQATTPDATITLSFYPTQTTWDVTGSSLGNTMTGNFNTTALTQGALTWTVTSGNGYFVNAPSGVEFGSSAVFQLGTADSDVTVTFNSGAGTVSESLHLSAAPVAWQYLRTEGRLSVSLASDQGTTLPAQGSAAVSVHADYITWDVYQSSDGQTSLQNYQTSPAAGGIVSLTASADGQINYYQPVMDSSGNLAASFTLGQSGESLVSADVSYYQSNSAQASLDFTAATVDTPTWHMDHVETTVMVQMSGSTSLTAAVSYVAWEAWTDGFGSWDFRNSSSGPAVGANVSFSLQSGNGYFSSADSSTDSNGNAFATFEGNTVDSVVGINVWYSTGSSFATLYVVGIPTDNTGNNNGNTDTTNVDNAWNFSYSTASLDAATSGGSVSATYHTWDVWMNGLTGETRVQNQMDTAVSGTVIWSVSSGDAIVSPDGTNVTAGVYDSTLTASINYNGLSTSAGMTLAGTGNVNTGGNDNNGGGSGGDTGGGDTGTTTVNVDDAWGYTASYGSLNAGLSDGAISVTYHSWEVWTNSVSGETRIQNPIDTAVGGSTTWSVNSGDATVTPDGNLVAGVTESNVTATITYNDLSASVSMTLAGTGTVTVEDPWTYTRTDASLDASSSGGSISATYHTWEVWTNSTTLATEIRNTLDTPASGAITWAVNSGDATVSSDGSSVSPGLMNSTATGTISFNGMSASASIDVAGTGTGGTEDVNEQEARRAYDKLYRDWQDENDRQVALKAELQQELEASLADEEQAQASLAQNDAAADAALAGANQAQAEANEAQNEANEMAEAAQTALETNAGNAAELAAEASGLSAAASKALGAVTELAAIAYNLIANRQLIWGTCEAIRQRTNGIQNMVNGVGSSNPPPPYDGPGSQNK